MWFKMAAVSLKRSITWVFVSTALLQNRRPQGLLVGLTINCKLSLNKAWLIDRLIDCKGFGLTVFHLTPRNELVFCFPDPFDQHRWWKLSLKFQHGGPFQFQQLCAVASFQNHLWAEGLLSFLTKRSETKKLERKWVKNLAQMAY